MNVHRPALLAATAVVISLGLTGCFANPLETLAQDGIEEGVENIIEEQTGSDVNLSTDGTASVPDSFPSRIPLPDGNVYFSQTVEDSWFVDTDVDSVETAKAGYQALLDAGFTEIGATDLATLVSYITEDDEYTVMYSYQTADDRIVVQVSVVTKEQ